LGSAFASLRGDRVIAVDANPDFGTLARRIPEQSTATVRTLLADENLCRYTDVRRHTNQAASRLEVIASERNPAMSESFDANDYRQVIAILQSYYNIIITDCGTGVVNSAMEGVLEMADAIIVVTTPAVDGAQSAAATLDWLEAHGYQRLVRESVVVISAARPGGAAIDVNALTDHFLGRVRAVQVIPYDDHLATGSYIDLDQMDRRTRTAFLELAATVADSFGPIGPLSAPQGWSPNEQRRR
jgi:MinD-like ATPase involved in chromosome partitioning or flagellar assembly